MKAISWMDVAVIIGYLLMMIGIGIWSSKKVKNLTDYALAGQKLGYPVMLGTLIGACIGAASTIGKAGKGIRDRSHIFRCYPGIYHRIDPLRFLFQKASANQCFDHSGRPAATIWKGHGSSHGGRYGSVRHCPLRCPDCWDGVGFSSIGSSYGLTYHSCILLAGGILIFYTLVGGLFAVAYTDMIQTIIMLACIGIIMPAIVLNQVPMENLSVLLKPHPGPILGGMTPFYVLSIFIIDFAFCLVDPGLWQRANAARDEKVIKRSMFVTAGVYFYWSLVIVFLGVAGTLLIPDVVARYGSSDAIIPALIVNYMPPVVVGLCLVALMAVMMSTASVALLIVGTTVASDLVPAFRPNTSEKGLLLYAKMSILIFGVLGIICALIMKGVFDILLLAFAIYVSAVFVPIMAAFYWGKSHQSRCDCQRDSGYHSRGRSVCPEQTFRNGADPDQSRGQLCAHVGRQSDYL